MKINRRNFLKETLAAGTMLAGAGSIISACSGIRRSDIPESSPTEQSNTKLDKVQKTILYYASLAPSGHNSQPWNVNVKSQNEWIIISRQELNMPTASRRGPLKIFVFKHSVTMPKENWSGGCGSATRMPGVIAMG